MAGCGCGRMWAWRAHAYGAGAGYGGAGYGGAGYGGAGYGGAGYGGAGYGGAGYGGAGYGGAGYGGAGYGASELRAERARRPALRAPDHVLVRVRAASLNPLDLAMIGGYGRVVLNAARRLEAAAGSGGAPDGDVEFPLVPGRDFAGEVVRAGQAAAARLPPGTRVWGVVPPHWPGALAQYVVARADWLGRAPTRMSDLEAGGALYAALTACSLLRVAGLAGRGEARGARVLLLGLGGVGQAALRLLAVRGASVVVGCAADSAEEALALGAVATLDRHRDDYDESLTESGPYDAILDCAGLGGLEASARPWRFGRYVTLTTPLLRETDERGVAAGCAAAAAELARQCARAARLPAPPPHRAGALPPHVRWAFFTPSQPDIDMLRRLTERGQFGVSVERAWGWRSAHAALARLAGGHARGKLLLDFTDDSPPPQEHS